MRNDITSEEFIEYFDVIAHRVHETSKEKGWWYEDRNDGELIALIHSELSEALEALRKGNQPDNHLPQHNGVVVELADAVIRIMDMAEARQWPLAQAIIEKIEYNKTREIRHGGKKF